ncbi:MAG TPA: GNAT family N-acetyltransferase [Polyangiaceae bacterium]
MNITMAEPGEADALTEIAIAAKRHWGYPEQWIQHWRPTLTITPAFLAIHDAFVARTEERSIGFAAMAAARELLWLEHLWVWPPAMGRGVGRALFRQAQVRARALGWCGFEIESDPHAGGFYERMGAKVVRMRRTSIHGEARELPVYHCHVR